MRTDYHTHLRPDEDGTEAERYFTVGNVERYVEAAERSDIEELGCSEHIHRFAQALEVWDHPFWVEQAHDDLDAYCDFVRSTPLRLGIEADFVPGAEDRLGSLLDERDFDYVIGSVHFLGDRTVDNPGYDVWEGARDPDEVWSRYFETVAEAARSGLFDFIAHPDLVKVWGPGRPSPQRDPRHHYEPAVEAIANAGIAAEVSTAGLRKPVGELYPAPALLEMLIDADVPLALSSDAHVPEHIGYGYEEAIPMLTDMGVGEICVFEDRRRSLEPLA